MYLIITFILLTILLLDCAITMKDSVFGNFAQVEITKNEKTVFNSIRESKKKLFILSKMDDIFNIFLQKVALNLETISAEMILYGNKLQIYTDPAQVAF